MTPDKLIDLNMYNIVFLDFLLVLLSAHVKKFSVSGMPDFKVMILLKNVLSAPTPKRLAVQIYLYICSAKSWASKFIWIFVCSNLGHLNIFGYSYAQFIRIRICSDICWIDSMIFAHHWVCYPV